MASKAQMTGMRAVYQVAAELVSWGYIVSPTSRSAYGADLLLTNASCTKAFSVQVKSNNQKSRFWLVGEKAKHLASPSHIYVFVNFDEDGEGLHGYWIVPSKIVKRTMQSSGDWHSLYKEKIQKYRDKWTIFGRLSST
ncbi:MAG: hypothetical protein FJ045_05090 [Crenarchaeota archaeon]|nr:hypothetical protein [Thermoproteota archaeon]